MDGVAAPLVGNDRTDLMDNRRFYKMSGSGNDFVFFDASDGDLSEGENAAAIRCLSARGTGVGAAREGEEDRRLLQEDGGGAVVCCRRGPPPPIRPADWGCRSAPRAARRRTAA